MGLILSSRDFYSENARRVILEHLPKPLEECRVLFLPNEKASRKVIRSERFYDRLSAIGFDRPKITVLDYYEAEKYRDLELDVIYAAGGNTFQTLERLRSHGFADAVVDYVRRGVTYVGGSAGAHIVSKNVEHVLRYDANPTGVTDFTGLGLFDGIFICHFCEERRAHFEQLQAEGRYRVVALGNDDAIAVDL